MSYEKVQSLSIKKDGTLSVRCASNNVTPVQYETLTLPLGDESMTERLRQVFNNLAEGNWQMNPSNKSIIYYHFLKALEDIEKREEAMIQFGRVEQREEHIDMDQMFLEVCKEKVWQAFLSRCLSPQRINVSDALYAVKLPGKGGAWLHGKTKHGYKDSMFVPKFHPIVKAEMLKRMYDGVIIEK